jgi:hypothetical protein
MTRRLRRVRSVATTGAVALAIVTALSATKLTPSAADDCDDLSASVTCGVGSDPSGSYFHGLIGVTGQDWVLDLGSRSGSSPGCGDCVWTVTLDCPTASPVNPNGDATCTGMQAGSAGCPPDASPYRLYLTTSTVTNELVGRICLGGAHHVVLVGEDAQADVDRYLHDVVPPDLLIRRRPHGPTLTGLPTYFRAGVPDEGLGPVSFGGPTVTESITLVPEQVDWAWGDDTSSGWLPVTEVAEHRYLAGGVLDGTLTTRWTATFTATFEGHTVGPFPATGVVDHRQPFVEPVDTSRPVLVGPES